MSEEEKYKASYMQNPFEISEDTLEKLEKHCKKMIHYERGRRENEHSNVLQLIYNYQDMQQELQLKDKVIEKMADRIDRGLILKDGSCFWYQERKNCEDYDEASDKCRYCIKQYFINKVKGE